MAAMALPDWPYWIAQQHPEWYFDTGDVILVSGRLEGPLFCVHTEILALNAYLFAARQLVLNGDPIWFRGLEVRVLYDTADDLCVIIKDLYESRHLDIPLMGPDCANRTSAVMDVAVNNRLAVLQQTCRNHVQSAWPMTARDWVAFEARLGNLPGHPEPASALVFAVRFNLPSIVAPTVAMLASIHPSNDYDRLLEGVQHAPVPGARYARWRMLNRRLLRTVETARGRLEHEIADYIGLRSYSPDNARSAAENLHPTCFTNLQNLPEVEELRHSTPRASPTLFNTIWLTSRGICPRCITHVRKHAINKLWDYLSHCLSTGNH